MALIYFITHPEVQFDWSIPVPQWDLSDKGRQRLEKLAQQPWIPSLTHLFASTETKAMTAANRIGQLTGLTPGIIHELSEIDRSKAGTVPPDQYSRITDEFFANPTQSAHGWEPATDAQQRIVTTLNKIIQQLPEDAVAAIISHGGVGTLLLCHLKKIPIARKEDQPSQGHYFLFDSTGTIAHGWKPIDTI